MDKRTRFYQIERDLAKVLNKWSVDNDFYIPDYILARYLMRQLKNLMDLNHELYKHRHGNVPGHNERVSTTMADSGVEKKTQLEEANE